MVINNKVPLKLIFTLLTHDMSAATWLSSVHLPGTTWVFILQPQFTNITLIYEQWAFTAVGMQLSFDTLSQQHVIKRITFITSSFITCNVVHFLLIFLATNEKASDLVIIWKCMSLKTEDHHWLFSVGYLWKSLV